MPRISGLVAKPVERTTVRVVTAMGTYVGGIRTYPATGDVYLCPDLVSEQDGRNVSLATILKENGIEPKTEINVRIEEGCWEIGIK